MNVRKMRLSLMALAFSAIAANVSAQVRVATYPEKSVELKDDYRVTVTSSVDGKTVDVPTLRCDVDLKKVQQASLALLEMEGGATVRVSMQKDTISSFMVRPTSKGIKAKKTDSRTIEFYLARPEYLSIEMNGDRKHNLHLLCDSLLQETYRGDEPQSINWTGQSAHDVFVKDARLIYFGPGIHRPKDLPSGDIRIPSHCTVYLAPGAVVRARLVVDHAEGVRIVGRGIIDHPLRGIEITHSKNVLVDGVTVLNPQHYTVLGGASDGITIRHLKAFSCKSWSDGIDLMSCRNVDIADIFMRNSDDCIALYNHRWWYWGNTSNVHVQRATLWADVAHPVNIGTHGDDRSEVGETLSGVRIEDCDVIGSCADAALKIASGDKNWIRGIRFDDIRMEGFEKGAMFSVQTIYSGKYNRAPGNGVDDVQFANITYTGPEDVLGKSSIVSYDASHSVKRVEFKNIKVNGKKWNEKKELLR